MLNLSIEKKLHYTLRIASAMCFIGHGAWGIITKPIWCNYFAVFGIGHGLAYRIMPFLGSFDILLGIVILFYPLRAIPMWLVLWGITTAMLRPLSGEPFAEFIERAGNFGAPLVLLILSSGTRENRQGFFSTLKFNYSLDDKTLMNMELSLRIIAFLLLSGHGWLNLIEKKSLINQYSTLGFSNPYFSAHLIGVFETIAAFSVLIRPFRSVVLVLLLWKIASELFYPQHELFEWIERGGSYGSILALWFILDKANYRSKYWLSANNYFNKSNNYPPANLQL